MFSQLGPVSRPVLAVERRAGSRRTSAVTPQCGNRGVLHAGPRQIGNGDVVRSPPARRVAGNDLPEFGKGRVGGKQAGLDGMVQFSSRRVWLSLSAT